MLVGEQAVKTFKAKTTLQRIREDEFFSITLPNPDLARLKVASNRHGGRQRREIVLTAVHELLLVKNMKGLPPAYQYPGKSK